MNARPTTFPAKQRDDFALAGTCKLPAGDWAARCQVRRAVGGPAWTLSVTLGAAVDGVTPIVIEAPAAITAEWPAEVLVSDIEFVDTSSGTTVHTERFQIEVFPVVTR